MKQFNSVEVIAGVVSVSAMAIALVLLRTDNVFSKFSNVEPGASQGAIVALSQKMSQQEREDAIAATLTSRKTVGTLIMDDVKVGQGDSVVTGDVVTVHFIGATQKGVEFQNTYTAQEPFTFTIGEGRVIEGWERGLLGMKKGGQRILVVPPELGYGTSRVGSIPPDSSLVFTIELLEIN